MKRTIFALVLIAAFVLPFSALDLVPFTVSDQERPLRSSVLTPMAPQATIFTETAGAGSTAQNFAIASYTGWSNPSFTFSGNGDVRTNQLSNGYTGASGGANVFLNNTISASFEIAGVNTSAYNPASLSLSFGGYKSTTGSNGSELTVQVSTNGTTYTNLNLTAFPTGTGTAVWGLRTVSGSIPATPNLRIRFTNTAPSGGPQFRIDDVMLTGTIAVPPGVTLSQSGGTTDVTEGGATDSYTVVLNSQPTANVAIALSSDSQTTVSPTSLVFTPANWNTPQTITVTAVDDNVYEGSHTGTIQHSASSSDGNYNNIAINSVTANVADNDTQPVVEFEVASKDFNESSGFGAGSMTVKRTSGAVGNTVHVNYNFTDGTAVGGGLCDGSTDFNNNTGTVTISANQTEAYIPIYLCNDSNAESTESFTVTLSNPTGGIIGAQSSATANILDDDNSVMELASTSIQATEDSTAQITVTRTGTTTGASSVSYTTTAGTATQGSCGQSGVDYVPSYGTLQFAAGETTKTISVTLCGDMVSESPAETIGLMLSSPTGGMLGTNTSATITVLDAASEFRNQTQLQYSQGGPAVGSKVDVTGYVRSVSGIKVTLYGVTTASAETLDVLLVDPLGTQFVMTSTVGGNNPLSNATLTFEDAAPEYMPFGSPIATGKNYKPTACRYPVTDFGPPAPPPGYGFYWVAGCNSSTPRAGFVTFGTGVPNGQWWLYVRDNTGQTTGVPNGAVSSTIAGWGLQFLVPTAANSSVSGRVRTADGRGIANAMVSIEGGGLASPVTTVTSSFGMYRFDGIPAGQTYVVTVRAKRFAFEMPSRVVSVTDDLAGVDFTAR